MKWFLEWLGKRLDNFGVFDAVVLIVIIFTVLAVLNREALFHLRDALAHIIPTLKGLGG